MTVEGGPFGSAPVAEHYRRYLQPVVFDPWATRLVEFAGLEPGQVVLDVAAGTGAVSRAAASVVGAEGRVIASDISAEMLSHVSEGADASAAPIELVLCPATDLPLPDDSVDVVLCQHGFQFMPDRVAVAREMRRVLRPGGVAAIAVFATGVRMEPFDSYADAMLELGVEWGYAPVPSNRLAMSEDEVAAALAQGGLTDVTTSTVSFELEWASADDAALGIGGTPFGSVVHSLDPQQRERLLGALRESFGGHGTPRPQRSVSVLGRGVAP